MEYLSFADLLPSLQSGFRPDHSSETAVLRVLSDILQAVDRGDSAALILLDLSAASDTVNHEVLLKRLQMSFGIDNTAYKWFQSYLSGRHQHMRRGSTKSLTIQLVCGVPQGSVLGPVLFVLYTVDLISLIKSHGLIPHLYADDTQIYSSCSPAFITDCWVHWRRCSLDEVQQVAAQLRLNLDSMVCNKPSIHKLPVSAMLIDGVPITPAVYVRDLGIYLSMRTHVQRTVSRCYAALRQLRQIIHSVLAATFQTLVVALVHFRLDYGNSVLVGIPVYLETAVRPQCSGTAHLSPPTLRPHQ